METEGKQKKSKVEGAIAKDSDLKRRKKVRPGKSHLKFPLYLDESIGFGRKKKDRQGSSSPSADISTLRNLHDAVSKNL